MNLSSPALTLSLHAIGGHCAISGKLPAPLSAEAEFNVPGVKDNGMNATFGVTAHCIAAEPHATVLRVGVADGNEVAFEVLVLARARPGYRVLQLRSALGTRIEICYLFVRINIDNSQPNMWATARELRLAFGTFGAGGDGTARSAEGADGNGSATDS